jgi:hypothetical protein
MSDNSRELISLLRTFDGDLECTGQGWADVGQDLCEKVIQKLEDNDWRDFQKELSNISNGQMHLLAFLAELAPLNYAVAISEYLVAHAEGEAWSEAAMVVGDLYISNPQSFSATRIDPSLRNKIECEIRGYINFQQDPETTFNEHIEKYSHLLEPGVIKYYEYIASNT